MKLPFVDTWFSQPGKSVLRMLPRRMIAPGYYENLPTAGPEFRYGIAADATGVQVCQPNGSGWAWRHTGGNDLAIYQDADYTGTSNTTSAQKIFDESTNGAANVAASTIYHMEGVVHIHTTDVDASTMSTLFGGTATLTWIGFAERVAFAATEGFSTGHVEAWITTAAATQILASTSSAKHVTITYNGHVAIANAGTFIPQYQFGSANQASPITGRGSWFRLTPVSATTMGNWS